MGTDMNQSEVLLDQKVAFLRTTAAYAHRPAAVEAVETHMAWVFLAGEFAFKLKKPVRYPFLDFSTLVAREFTCREEVRLNERLAVGVYLGVVPLKKGPNGQLDIGGEGEIIDWLVKMKRLPTNRMLDAAIAAGTVSRTEIGNVAHLLTVFYRQACRASQPFCDTYARFVFEHQRNLEVLSQPGFSLDHRLTADVLEKAAHALEEVRPLVEDRASLGMIVEGHGDLRPEHVCLVSPPIIIDCLEFNRDLRMVDPYDEIAFLSLECERLGASWIGNQLLEIVTQGLGSPPAHRLMAFYRASRALLRARLALSHLTEPNPRTPEKWEPRARSYIELAKASLAEFGGNNQEPATEAPSERCPKLDA